EGHGERKPEGIANHDMGDWGKQLQAKGIKIRSLNLADTPVVPRNTAALVIASPQLDYLPGEIKAIQQYIEEGGNLLWLVEPDRIYQLQAIAELLDLEFLHGIIVDPNTQLLGINDPRFAIVSQYSQHPLTGDFTAVTIFPQARGIKINPTDKWQHSVILQTTPRSWSETGELAGQIEFNKDSDIPGPLMIGVAITREIDTSLTDAAQDPEARKKQRIVVIGDGDFLSNTYLGNGGNFKLGLNIANWLAHDDRFIAIPARSSPDLDIALTSTAKAILAFGFLILLPLLLGATGTLIWLKRRKR
ncbi:GldG family protein, partial [Kaarinaea lacus]